MIGTRLISWLDWDDAWKCQLLVHKLKRNLKGCKSIDIDVIGTVILLPWWLCAELTLLLCDLAVGYICYGRLVDALDWLGVRCTSLGRLMNENNIWISCGGQKWALAFVGGSSDGSCKELWAIVKKLYKKFTLELDVFGRIWSLVLNNWRMMRVWGWLRWRRDFDDEIDERWWRWFWWREEEEEEEKKPTKKKNGVKYINNHAYKIKWWSSIRIFVALH